MSDDIELPTFMQKYQNPVKYGPLSDKEVLDAIDELLKAADLAHKFDAGLAVKLYYITLYGSFMNIARARHLV